MRLLSIATVFSFLLSLVECQPQKAETRESARISVTTEVATATTDYLSKTYIGTIEEHSTTPVSFTGVGKVVRVYVEEGQHVDKGQLIAALDTTQSANMLATAQAQMDQANDALARMQQLHDLGSLPDIKWVEVQSQVSQAESQLAMAQKNLEDCRIYAPVSGIVGRKVFQDGMTAVTSEPVVTLLDISSVYCRVSIPEKEIADIKSSTRTTVTIDAIGRSLEGGRIEKCVTADATTHTYDIKIALPNHGRELLPGMIASVRIASTSPRDVVRAITLPIRAVQQSSDGSHFVWLAVDGKAQRHGVTLGDTYGNRVIVRSGLSGGESVITEGYQKVGEGSAIVLAE